VLNNPIDDPNIDDKILFQRANEIASDVVWLQNVLSDIEEKIKLINPLFQEIKLMEGNDYIHHKLEDIVDDSWGVLSSINDDLYNILTTDIMMKYRNVKKVLEWMEKMAIRKYKKSLDK